MEIQKLKEQIKELSLQLRKLEYEPERLEKDLKKIKQVIKDAEHYGKNGAKAYILKSSTPAIRQWLQKNGYKISLGPTSHEPWSQVIYIDDIIYKG